MEKPIKLDPAIRRELEKANEYLALMDNAPGLKDGTITELSGVDHALCYDTGRPGKTAAIIIGTHMNELAGFAAATDFHERWTGKDIKTGEDKGKKERPATGKVYVIVGGNVSTTEHLLKQLLSGKPPTQKEFLSYRSKILTSSGQAHAMGHLNHNRLPLRLRDEAKAMENEVNLYWRINRIHKRLSECDGGVLDIHTTSQPSKTMVSPFTKAGEGDDVTLAKTAAVTKGMRSDFVTLYKEHDLLTMDKEDPAYSSTELPLRGFAKVPGDAVSLLVETGQHLDHKAFENAKAVSAAWLHNVIGMPLKKGMKMDACAPTVLKDITGIYHPGAMPAAMKKTYATALEKAGAPNVEAIMNDHYFLIHNTRMLEPGHAPAPGFQWSAEAKKAIATYKSEKRFGTHSGNRLGFYEPFKKDEIIAIGLNTGHAITLERNGYVFMINQDPDLATEHGPLGYFGATSQEQARAPAWRKPPKEGEKEK